jgi:hypothetical protein
MSLLCLIGLHQWKDGIKFVRNARGRFAKQRTHTCAQCGREKA